MHDNQEDYDAYADDHEEMFGHRPIPDLSGKKLCVHPVHDAMRSMMNAPGVNIEIPFEYQQMISNDDEQVTSAWDAYDRKVDHYKDIIREIEGK